MTYVITILALLGLLVLQPAGEVAAAPEYAPAYGNSYEVVYAAPEYVPAYGNSYEVVYAAPEYVPAYGNSYELAYTVYQTNTLDISIDTTDLFEAANLMISALSPVYLFIAGLALGVGILAAIVKAIMGLRL